MKDLTEARDRRRDDVRADNTVVKYADFCERFKTLVYDMYPGITVEKARGVLTHAWEDCAWCQTLTDERGILAIKSAHAQMFGRGSRS